MEEHVLYICCWALMQMVDLLPGSLTVLNCTVWWILICSLSDLSGLGNNSGCVL